MVGHYSEFGRLIGAALWGFVDWSVALLSSFALSSMLMLMSPRPGTYRRE